MARAPGGVGARRRAREWALQILYSLDTRGILGESRPSPEEVDAAIAQFWHAFDDEREASVTTFAGELVKGTVANVVAIDAAVQTVSRNWRLDRMARVDRNILRLATFELRFASGVPAKVVINEAIEVAKRFGTAESPAFVNGLLDRIAQEPPAE